MTGNIPKDRRVHVQITLIVFIIYVLFKIKLYLLLLHCLFESFVNMYLLSLSIITLVLHVWCCSKLTAYTNVEMSNVCYQASLVKCICKFTVHQWVPLKLWNCCLFDRQFLIKPPYFVQMMYWSCDIFILCVYTKKDTVNKKGKYL